MNADSGRRGALFLALILVHSAAGVQQAHGVSEVLRGDDADDAVAVEDGDELGSLASHDAAEGFYKGVVRLGRLEGAGHHSLDIAVAFGLQGFDDALAGDGTDESASANDRKDILQGMDAALESLFEGGRGRERGEVGEHDVAHAKWVGLGVEQEAGIVHVGADEDEAADHDEPHVGQDASGDGKDETDDLTETGRRACSFEHAMVARELAAEDAAPIERGGGEEIDGSEEEVDPDYGAEEVRGGKPGALEEADLGGNREDDGGEDEAEDEIRDRAHDAETLADLGGCGALGCFGSGVLLQAPGGEKKDAAELEAVPCGGDRASDFANGYCKEEQRPEKKASTACRSGDRRVADGETEQQKEEGMNAYLHT